MARQMKAVQPRKRESMTLTIPAPKARMPRIPQRGATFRSGKEYRRKEGKRVDS